MRRKLVKSGKLARFLEQAPGAAAVPAALPGAAGANPFGAFDLQGRINNLGNEITRINDQMGAPNISPGLQANLNLQAQTLMKAQQLIIQNQGNVIGLAYKVADFFTQVFGFQTLR